MEEKKKKRTHPVFVLDKNNNPLMPTRRFGWVRRGLRNGKLKVVRVIPFVVQLCYDIEEPITQELRVGVDIGHTHIGISVCSEKEEMLSLQTELRTDIKDSMHERAVYRHGRRHRGPSRPKKKDFSKSVGWLAPSMDYVVVIHMNIIKRIKKILPITEVRVEKCKFDFQLMMDPTIVSTDYQNGPQKEYDNTRQYIIARDHNECQLCHGKSRDKTLEVHHIIFRSDGGTNIPSNLITLCKKCHKKLHDGKVKLDVDKTEMPQLRPAATVNIISKEIVKRIESLGLNVETTFGYITNFNRKQLSLGKSHVNDAFVIGGFTDAKRLDVLFKVKSFKRHYRKLHEAQPRLNMFYHHRRENKTIKRIDRKGKNKNKKYGMLLDGSFVPKPRRFKGSVSLIRGFAARDVVKYNKELWFVTSRRSSGYFNIKYLKSEKKLSSNTIHVKNLKLVQRGKTLMITEICEKN